MNATAQGIRCARLPGRVWALAGLLVLGPAGCDRGPGRAEFDHQVEVCSLAADNGLLDAAAAAGGAALQIAEHKSWSPAEVADLQYRLARLERQRGQFEDAESLARQALSQAEAADEASPIAERSIELAMALAGQGRWLAGLAALDRVTPLLSRLTVDEVRSAGSAYRLFSVRLGFQGHADEAAYCRAMAAELKALESS